jgi:trimethylamine--corrinoid protein Co-methyltransferase
MSLSFPELTFRPELRVLSEPQIREIHWASLEVLERTGLIIRHPRMLEALADAGGRVSGDRVRLPAFLVEDCLRRAPRRLVLGRRNGERRVFLQGGYSWFGPSLDCVDYLDPVDGRRSPFRLEHCAANARLVDALPNFEWSMIIGMAGDCHPRLADRLAAKAALTNTEKPLVFCCNDAESLKAVYEMALIITDGRRNFDQAPLIVHYSEPLSPLTYYGPSLDKIIFCCENRLPLIILSAPQAGGTGPASLVGSLVMANAESLSGLVMAQVLAPGTPFLYGIQSTIMDMRTTIFTYGSAEQALMLSAVSQLAGFYGLPLFGTAGSTDSRHIDPQAGLESTFQCLAAAASGSGLVHDCGSWLDHGSLASPEYMFLMNEIIFMVRQFMKGLPVNRESMSVEIIDQIGPGGNFLRHPSTRRICREMFYSKLFDRSMAEKPGQPRFGERLRGMTLESMKHQPVPLAPEKARELDRMEAVWRESLG